MKKKVVIFGTGQIAQLANFYFTTDDHEVDIVAHVVDDSFFEESTFCDVPVVRVSDVVLNYPPLDYFMFIAVSYADMNEFRKLKYVEMKGLGYQFVSYISSKVSYISQYPCGENCFILEDNTIQPFVEIGTNVTLWSGNHIGHHSVIADNVFISSHVVVSGNCRVEEGCFIGVNATLHNGITLANRTLVAAGAIITKSTCEEEVWLPQRSHLFKKSSTEIKL